uniref:Uncharacterized protein n=1 Tax=Accipiter nisus TaxID=211598 RepID=A0A8B9MQH2_9AVES
MDNKPLLQERPPAYSPAAQGAGYDYGQSNYGAIPAPQPAPPPFPFLPWVPLRFRRHPSDVRGFCPKTMAKRHSCASSKTDPKLALFFACASLYSG